MRLIADDGDIACIFGLSQTGGCLTGRVASSDNDDT
jgi:hypothetical protein